MKAQSRFTYSPTLIQSLEGDHAELLQMYTQVDQMLKRGDYEAIVPALGTFKTKLDVHILNENLRFYCYLEEHLAGSPDELNVMKDFRREMNDIARGVVNFVRKYQMAGVTLSNHKNFGNEFQQVGALLAQRIEREERGLYILYTP
ncbi:MAG: hemerythrin domain-containing protein [Stenotrophobium sp.]